MQAFNPFYHLHNMRKSDCVQYLSFYDSENNLIQGVISAAIDENGQITSVSTSDTVYTEFTYYTECLYVLGIGTLLPGDIVKLKIDDNRQYELNYGWHVNVSGQCIFSWYLKPVHIEKLFENKIYERTQEPDITNTGILTLYKEYLDTIEVVEFKNDRTSFHCPPANGENTTS